MSKPGMWVAAAAALWVSTGVAYGQGKNSPTCGTDLVATVELSSATLEGDGAALQSDGLGPYGGSSKENVRLQINNCSFDLVMNFATSRRRVIAYLPSAVPLTLLNFDRLASVPVGLTWNGQRFFQPDPDPSKPPVESTFCYGGAPELVPPPSTSPQDNYGGCGWDGTRVYVRRTLTAQFEGRDDRRLVMQTSPWDGHSKPLREYCDPEVDPSHTSEPACNTSYVRVSRTSPNTWILSPEPTPATATPIAVENLHTSAGVAPQGTHVLPFKITVTTRP